MLKKILCICATATFSFLSYVQADEERTRDADPSIENLLFHDKAERSNLSLACEEESSDKGGGETRASACCEHEKNSQDSEPGVFSDETEDKRDFKENLAGCKRCRERRRVLIEPSVAAFIVNCDDCDEEKRNVEIEAFAHHQKEVKDLFACKDCK